MKALDQVCLNKQYIAVQAECEATAKALAELAAKHVELQHQLERIHLNQVALGNRPVPDYPAWLQADDAKSSG